MGTEHQLVLSHLKKDELSSVETTYQQLIESLSPFKINFSDDQLKAKMFERFDVIIILDDDPTGTQTVHDIPVLTEWSPEILMAEIELGTSLFFILTNSRSLIAEDAKRLNEEIASNIKHCVEVKHKKCLIVSRSDSTLRGHYPLEINALTQVFQPNKAIHFIVPAFFEGGRFTIDNIHYVREGDQMIPAAKTAFAQDKVFGFKESDLSKWVAEKFDYKIAPSQVNSISLSEIEQQSIGHLVNKINGFSSNEICIINAVSYEHLKQALMAIFSSAVDPYFRCAASLVRVLAGQSPLLIDSSNLDLDFKKGGLTVLGSYVPKSTSQLNDVLENVHIEPIEINIPSLLEGQIVPVESMAQNIDKLISSGHNVILFTSRQLITSDRTNDNLAIGSKVSQYLTDIVSALKVNPRYIIGKGGITSSDLATKSLMITRAQVIGQMIPGVPVWKTLACSKFPDMPFIVYPGNVGDHTGLTQVIQKLNPKP